MKKVKRITLILALVVSGVLLALQAAKAWEHKKIINIMNAYSSIDRVEMSTEQAGARVIDEMGWVEQAKQVCRLRALYPARNVEKTQASTLCTLQFYAQEAMVGTARLYKVWDGGFMEKEKQEKYQVQGGFYYVLEWENRWAFPLQAHDARALLALLKPADKT